MSVNTGAAVVLSVAAVGPEVVPQWKKDLIARLKSQNKRFGYEIPPQQQHQQQQHKDGSTLFGRTIVPQPNHHQHPLHHHQYQPKQRQSHQPATAGNADEQVQAPVIAVPSSAAVPAASQCQCRVSASEQCNYVNKMVQVYNGNSEHFDDYHHPCSGSEEEEDLRYGPGIVSKLKNKYLSLALRQSTVNSRPTILRKATSLENILDDGGDDDVDSANDGTDKVPSVQYRNIPDLKRARSVETISCTLLETEVQKPKRESYHEDMPSHRSSYTSHQNKYQRPLNRPKRIAPLLNDKEKPPADVVKQAKRIFEKNHPQKYRKSSPTPGGVVAEKVDAFNSIIGSTKAKKPPIKQKPQDKLLRSRKILKSDNRLRNDAEKNGIAMDKSLKSDPKFIENIDYLKNHHNETVTNNKIQQETKNSEIIKNGVLTNNHDVTSVSEAVNFNNKAAIKSSNETKSFNATKTGTNRKQNDILISDNYQQIKPVLKETSTNSIKDLSKSSNQNGKESFVPPTSPLKEKSSPIKTYPSPTKELSSPIKEHSNSVKELSSPVKELPSPVKDPLKSSQNPFKSSLNLTKTSPIVSPEDSKPVQNNLKSPTDQKQAKLNITPSSVSQNKVPPNTLTETVISPIPDVSNSNKKPPEKLRLLASETPDLILTSSPIVSNHQSKTNNKSTQDIIKSTETFLNAELNKNASSKCVKPVALDFTNEPTANNHNNLSSTNKSISKTAAASSSSSAAAAVSGKDGNNIETSSSKGGASQLNLNRNSKTGNNSSSANGINGDGLVTVPKKSRSGSDSSSGSAGGGNTFLFNFTDRKDVPDYISNDKSRSPASPGRPDLPKAGEGGIILLPGATIIDTYLDEEDEIMRSLEAPPSPCDVTFINDNILIDGKSSLSQKAKRSKMRISFVTAGPEIFEYPSETSLLLDDLPTSPVVPPSIGGSNNQLGHTVPNLVGSSLANYTPKSSSPHDFQPGITRTAEIEPPKVNCNSISSTNEELYEEQENPVLFSAGTNSDILF